MPELASSAYGDATVRHLLDMTVGIRYTEDHEDDETEDARLDRLCGVKPSRAPDEPGSAYDYATTTVKEGEHGARAALRLAQHGRARLGDGAGHRTRPCPS